MAAPLQCTCQHSFFPAGLCTSYLAAVSCSATTIAVLVCSVGSVQSILDSPSAKAMKMMSWSCNLHICPQNSYSHCYTLNLNTKAQGTIAGVRIWKSKTRTLCRQTRCHAYRSCVCKLHCTRLHYSCDEMPVML